MKQPIGVILAGGLARRMGGGDKGRLDLGGQSILDHVIARLAPQVDHVVINANGDQARFEDLNLPVIADSVADYPGPLAGVLAGLDWAAEVGADAIVTAAVDTPFFPSDLVPQLMSAAAGMPHPLALAATHDPHRDRLLRHPTFGLWPVALREDLRTALRQGVRKVVLWTDQHNAQSAQFPAEPDPFFNVNTPEDLQRARTLYEGMSC